MKKFVKCLVEKIEERFVKWFVKPFLKRFVKRFAERLVKRCAKRFVERFVKPMAEWFSEKNRVKVCGTVCKTVRIALRRTVSGAVRRTVYGLVRLLWVWYGDMLLPGRGKKQRYLFLNVPQPHIFAECKIVCCLKSKRQKIQAWLLCCSGIG